MTAPTLDQVLHDARALPRAERARLVAAIVEELAAPLQTPAPRALHAGAGDTPDAAERAARLAQAATSPASTDSAWDEFAALADDPAVATPLPDDSAILISEMRR